MSVTATQLLQQGKGQNDIPHVEVQIQHLPSCLSFTMCSYHAPHCYQACCIVFYCSEVDVDTIFVTGGLSIQETEVLFRIFELSWSSETLS